MAPDFVLRISDLHVSYIVNRATANKVLDGFQLDIGAGESVGILGESGSGKTTLAWALLGQLPANGAVTSGSIQFRGEELVGLKASRFRAIRGAGIALMSQEPATALNPVLRVGTQIMEVLRAHTALNPRARRERAAALLAQMGFAEPEKILECYPHALSGGQRQRILLAQALACHPALLILDEPTAALDSVVQAEIIALLRRVSEQEHMAMLVISHNPAVLDALTSRMIVLENGRIVRSGDTASILSAHGAGSATLHPSRAAGGQA